jgi:hypothetical protein
MALLSLIKNFKAPALPVATVNYDETATNQFARLLRIYFNQLDQLLLEIVATIRPAGTEDDPLYVGKYDSKGRLQVTAPEVLFFNTFQYGVETDVWDTSLTSGGTAVFDATTSSVQMGVTSTIGSKSVRQTLNVQKYIPGRTSTLSFAVRMQAPVAGIRRRFGLFDGADGFYFEDNGGDYACVLVNSGAGTTNRVSRANWNGDKLDGTGPSGITADPAAIQMITVVYEWYGAGQVAFEFIIDGNPIVVQTFNTANTGVAPWCKTPFLPIRMEIENVSAATGPHYIWQGSNSLIADGSTNKAGIAQNILTPTAGISLTTANTFYPVVSIRLKSTMLQGVILPTSFQAATLDNTSIFFKLIRNATVNGTWVDMPDANSFAQYNYTSTGAITNGTDLFSGYIPSNSGGVVNKLDPETAYQIGRSALGTVSDTLTLAIAATNANKQGVGALTWIEQR